MSVFKDQLDRTITLDKNPLRIISLVPSQTELLYHLGLDNEVVGITKFCIHPDSWFRTKTRIGGTKTVNIERVKSLQPTLIIANKEENTKSELEALEQICTVWISDVRDIPSALEMIQKVGALVGKDKEAQQLAQEIQLLFNSMTGLFSKQRALYVIWNDPIMVAAKNTFIDSVLEHLGLENAASAMERYPEISVEQLQILNPDFIFLSSEPFPFKQKHLDQFKRALPKSQVHLVDGELFSWYGSRLLHSASYFLALKNQVSV
jgi:ABC-type Fe3+-hydroxamate transport system substrate-binding protein